MTPDALANNLPTWVHWVLVLATVYAANWLSMYGRDFGTDWNDVEFLIAVPYFGFDSAEEVPSVQAAQRLAAESNSGGDDDK